MPSYTKCQTPRCRKYADLNENGFCPQCVKKQEKLSLDVVPYPCKTCSKNCKDENSCMQCDLCLDWHHIVCVDISKEAYQLLQNLSGSRWFCSKCNTKVDQLIEKANGLEIETQAVKEDVIALKKRMDNVEKKLTGSVEKEIAVALNEKTDIERRKLNLIVFNLPECDTGSQTVWDLPEKIQKDIDTITSVIKSELEIEMDDNVISDARRLGKKQTEGNRKGKPRPLKIVFSDLRKKRQVLEAAKNFRKSEDDIAKHLFINPDLTEIQREKDRALRKVMWERREKGENVIIQRGEIVQADWEVRKTRPNKTIETSKPSASSNKGPQ